MARARMIKPGFYTNDVLAEIAPIGRILFSGLWCIADRAGRLEDRPRKIKAEILPYDDADVDALLDELAARGFVVRYQHGGVRYLQVSTFGKHQTPHIKEAASIIPAPDEHDTSTVLIGDERSLQDGSLLHKEKGDAPDEHRVNTVLKPLNTLTNTHNQNTEPKPKPSAPSAAVSVGNITELTDERPQGMVVAFCAAIGADVSMQAPGWVSKQRAVAKRLLEEGYSIEKVIACALFRQSQEWRNEPFDLFDIEKGIGKWEAGGSPPVARSRPSAPRVDRATHIVAPGGDIRVRQQQ